MYILPNSHTFPVTISENLADQNGFLKISEQLMLQQDAGEEHLAFAGLESAELIKRGFVFIIIKTRSVRHKVPKLDDPVRIITWHKENRGIRFFRCYKFTDNNGNTLIDSVSSFVLIDIKTRRVLRPNTFTDICGCQNSVSFPTCENPAGITVPEKMKKAGRRVILPGDIDFIGHVNNTIYGGFITEFMDSEFKHRQIKEFEIHFEKEALLHDTIEIFTAAKNNEVYFKGIHGRGLCFTAHCIV